MGSNVSEQTKLARSLLILDTVSSYAEIARRAGVHRDTLYKDPVCAAIIKQRREQSTQEKHDVQMANDFASKNQTDGD